MRTKNAFRNLVISLIYELFLFAAGIIVPRFIIITYGSEINGLTSTINRLLSLVNLIQAGAVGTAIYQMYKPVAIDDYDTQSAILYSSKRFYNLMGIVYLIIATVIAVFYAFYLENTSLKFFEIFLSFLILTINGSLYLFFTTKFDIFFSPHQKKYILIIASLIEKIIYYCLLVFILIGKLYFMWMYAAILIGSLCRVLFNSYFYYRYSKGKITRNPSNKNYKIPDRKYLMMSSIGQELMTYAPTIIITTIVNLVSSSVFSIYSMIYTSMKTILNSIQLAISAIFGNLVNTSNNDRINAVYNKLSVVFIMLGAFLASCCAFMFMPFIDIYTAGFVDANYSYPILAIFVVCYIVVFSFKISISYVATVYGLFKSTCKITLTFATIGLIISICSTIIWGMPYVMIGVLFYELASCIATIVVMKKKIDWFNLKGVIKRLIILILLPIISYVIYYNTNIVINTWLMWIAVGFICAGVFGIIILIYCLIFERYYFLQLLLSLKNIFTKKRKRDNYV